jgi:hypothetical protein
MIITCQKKCHDHYMSDQTFPTYMTQVCLSPEYG